MSETTTKQDELLKAVDYAMRSGCFFPVPQPKPPYRVRDLIKWGAMRNLHRAYAELHREDGGDDLARIGQPVKASTPQHASANEGES
jgi:hypothetical protein